MGEGEGGGRSLSERPAEETTKIGREEEKWSWHGWRDEHMKELHNGDVA